MVLAGEREKKEECAKPRTEGREVSYGKIGREVSYDCGCNSGSPLRDAVGSKNRTHPPLEQYITWTRTTQCPTVKLICLTACKKAMHATSRWYRTVYIPWLVAFYNTHKGKRWLNSNPPNHRGKDYDIQIIDYYTDRTDWLMLISWADFDGLADVVSWADFSGQRLTEPKM